MADVNNPWAALMPMLDQDAQVQLDPKYRQIASMPTPANPAGTSPLLDMSKVLPVEPITNKTRKMVSVPDASQLKQAQPDPMAQQIESDFQRDAAPQRSHAMQRPTQDSLDYLSSFKNLMAQRDTDAAELQKQLAAERGKDFSGIQYADWSPLTGFVDSMTGSKFSQNYQAPQDKLQSQAVVQKLQEALAKNKDGRADDFTKMYQVQAIERARMDQNDAARERADILRSMSGEKLDMQKQKLGLAEDNAMKRVNDSWDNNHLMATYSQSFGALHRGEDLLLHPPIDPTTKQPVITGQILKSVSDDMARAVAMGATSDDARQKKEFNNYETRLAGLRSQMSKVPVGVGPDNPLVLYIATELKQIKQGMADSARARAMEIHSGRNYSSPKLRQAEDEKYKRFADLQAAYGTNSTPANASVGAVAPPSLPPGLPSFEDFLKTRSK